MRKEIDSKRERKRKQSRERKKKEFAIKAMKKKMRETKMEVRKFENKRINK